MILNARWNSNQMPQNQQSNKINILENANFESWINLIEKHIVITYAAIKYVSQILQLLAAN